MGGGPSCAFLLCAGGYSQDYNETLNSMEVYDPVTDAWSLSTPMPTPRGDVMCTNLLETFVVVGGYWDPTGESRPLPERPGVPSTEPPLSARCTHLIIRESRFAMPRGSAMGVVMQRSSSPGHWPGAARRLACSGSPIPPLLQLLALFPRSAEIPVTAQPCSGCRWVARARWLAAACGSPSVRQSAVLSHDMQCQTQHASQMAGTMFRCGSMASGHLMGVLSRVFRPRRQLRPSCCELPQGGGVLRPRFRLLDRTGLTTGRPRQQRACDASGQPYVRHGRRDRRPGKQQVLGADPAREA